MEEECEAGTALITIPHDYTDNFDREWLCRWLYLPQMPVLFKQRMPHRETVRSEKLSRKTLGGNPIMCACEAY